MKSFFLKLTSVAIAVMLWHFVSSESNLTRLTFSAPIEVRDVPNGKTILSLSPRQAQVEVKGPALWVSKIPQALPAIRIKVPDGSEQRFDFPLRQSDIELPPNVTVESIEPPEVHLELDSLKQKTVKVVVPRIGLLSGALEVKDIQIRPSTVEITGPASEIAEINSVETYPIDLASLNGSTEKGLNLRVPNAHVNLAESEVKAKIEVQSIQMERRFAGLPIEVRATNSERVALQPSTVMVEVTGPRDAVKKLSAQEVIPYVRLGSSDDGFKDLQVEIDLPAGIALAGIEPQTVAASRVVARPVAQKAVPPKNKK